jgi:hypothetical protein
LRAPEDTAEAFVNAPTLTDVLEEVADPSLAKVVREAVWFCWEQGRPGYSPTAERRRFMQNYIGRIPTARLLDEAWVACPAEEKDAMRARVLRRISEPEEKSAPNLDSLSDDQVQNLYWGTLRKIATESRYASI